MNLSFCSNTESILFPRTDIKSINVVLSPPTMGRIVNGRAEARALRAGSEAGHFAGEGTESGIKVERIQSERAGVSELVWKLASSEALQGVTLSQSLHLEMPSTSYVIAPGVLYDGNRFLVSPQPYCPHIPGEGVSPEGSVLVADVPRLTADTGYQVELAGNAFTTPFVGLYDEVSGSGMLFEFPVYGDWGVSGITISAQPSEALRLTISLPVQRVRRYRFCDWEDANEPGMNLAPGQMLEARARVFPVQAATIPAFVSVLAKISFEARDRGPLASRKNLGRALREAGDRVEAKCDRYNWDEARGFYRTVPTTIANPLYLLQSGWSGGGTTLIAMLLSADPVRRARARRMATFLCQGATARGYFHGCFDGQRWLSVGLKRPGCQAFSFVRRTLECGRDLIKAIEISEGRGETAESLWLETARRFLDAVLDTERRFGHLGYTINPETGDVIWGASTASAFAIEALVRGHRRFNDPACLAAAVRLARFCRDGFVARGYTLGGVGDALMAVDSESTYALLAGLVHLHGATQDPEHLAWAVEAADLFQTWILLYDARFPEGTPLQRLGIEPRGAVFANIQNQHGAPGIFIASGLELATLAERTGDARYLVLLREITGCIPQMVVRAGQEEIWGTLPEGSLSERLMTMDGLLLCGHTERIDTFGPVAMISANEIPVHLLES